MGRIRQWRRTVPIVLLWCAVCLPIILAAFHSPAAVLPKTGWVPLLLVALRTLALTAGAATCSAIVGAAIVVSACTCRSPLLQRSLVLCSLLPFVVPIVATGVAFAPYAGKATVFFALVVTGVPFAVVAQLLAVRSIDRRTFDVTRDLALSPSRTWAMVVAPPWRKGAVTAWVWSVLVGFSDPMVYEVFGGTISYLPSHTLRSVVGGAPASQIVGGLLLYLVPAMALSFWVVSHLSHQRVSMPAPMPMRDGAAIVRRYHPYPAIRVGAHVLTTGAMIVMGMLAVRLVTSAWRAFPSSLPDIANELAPVIVHLLIVLSLSNAIAIILAISIYRASSRARKAGWVIVLFMAVSPPAAVGAIMALGLRMPVIWGSATVMPSLVGGGALGSGYGALVLASMALCVPLSTALIVAVRSSDQLHIRETALTLGSSTLRTTVQVEGPTVLPVVLIALGIETSMVLTFTAPVVFVQPVGVSFAASRVASLAATGQESAAMAYALLIAAFTTAAIAAIYTVLRTTLVARRSIHH